MINKLECYNDCSVVHIFWEGVSDRIVNSRSPLFKWHHFMFFGSVREVFPYTNFTYVDVTNVAAHRGNGGLAEVTPDEVLGAALGVHDLKSF